MKRNLLNVTILLLILISMLTGCSDATQNDTRVMEPDIFRIRSICELSTLECYYHNVAKSTKEAGSGLSRIGEKDRTYWIEYDGIIKIGIDMSKVEMDCKEGIIKITLPAAQVLNASINQNSYNENSYFANSDGLNKNKITAEDATKAVDNAQKEMVKSAKSNTALLQNAQNRAKELIGNYISEVESAMGVSYKIEWILKEN